VESPESACCRYLASCIGRGRYVYDPKTFDSHEDVIGFPRCGTINFTGDDTRRTIRSQNEASVDLPVTRV